MTKITMTKDGKTAELFPNPQVNAFIRSGWELSVGSKEILATKNGETKKITNTAQLNAYVNAPGWVISVEGGIVPPEPNPCSIAVTTRDEELNPMGGITVTLLKNGSEISTGITNTGGGYTFSGLTDGTYTFDVQGGYDDGTWKATPSSVLISKSDDGKQFTVIIDILPAEEVEPQRAALELEAAKLGVTFNKNISTENLQKRVKTAREKTR